MLQLFRRIGIAFGSIVAAWLVISLFGGASLGSALVGLAAVLLGGLIYRDIVRRERPAS
jgi:hypothetical protein